MLRRCQSSLVFYGEDRCSIADLIEVRVLSRPSISMLSKRGGDTRNPVRATRSEPKSCPTLTLWASASDRRDVSSDAAWKLFSVCNLSNAASSMVRVPSMSIFF